MTTRPTLDTTPEDASLARFTRDVEKFVEELIGDERVPSPPLDIKVTSQENSVKVTWRTVNEVGVTEYEIFRGTEKNFSGDKAELIATVTQAINPEGTSLVYIDAEATEKSFYFVRAVKGLRRPKIAGPVVGFGTSVAGGFIGEGSPGGSIPGFTGISGSILFVNDDLKIDQDNDNLFYSHPFKAMVVGPRGLMWGPHASPDVILLREASDTLAMKRGTTPQAFRVYETIVGGGSGPAITATRLTSGASEPDATVFTTASVSPGSNKLVLAIVNGLRLAVSPNSAPTAAGNGLTWVQVATVAYEHAGGETGRTRMSVFRAMGVSPSSGAISFTFPETQARASWSIIEFDNIDTGGANGADAIIQAVISAEATTTNPIATLAAFGATVNATFGTTGWAAGDPSVTPGAGFAELSEDDLPPNGTGVQTQFRNDNDTTVDVTYGSPVRTVIFGIEIKNASQPGGGIFLELDALGSSGGAEVMVDDSSGNLRELGVGTRHLADTVIYTNDLEVARFGTDGSLELDALNLADSIFLDSGSAILGTGNPRIWMGQTATKTVTNFTIGAAGTDVTRVNGVRTVLISVSNDEYLKCSNVGITQVSTRHRLHIDPIEDQVQLLVSGHTTQASDLFQLQTFDNLFRFGVDVSGNMTLAGSITMTGGTGTHLRLPPQPDNDASTPTLAFGTAFNTGFYENSEDSLQLSVAGGARVRWNTTGYRSLVSSSWQLNYGIATRTGPPYTFQGDQDTGIGHDAAGNVLTLVAGGIDVLTVENAGDGLITIKGDVLLSAADLGNNVPGRCGAFERNISASTEGQAPGTIDLEAADGASLILWSDDDGDLRVHTAKPTGNAGTPTVDANTAGFKLSPLERDHFHFASRIGSFGVEFTAGGYTFSTTDANLTQASATVTIGTANHPYYAHAFLVAAAAGAASGGAGLVEIEVSGTSVDDNGVRTASDTEILVADITAMATDQFFETVKKWIGTVTWTLQVAGGGTHTTFNADFNYGLAKYEDFGNMDFEITGFELTGRAGANDTGFNVELCEHKATGWTYAATGFNAGLGTPLVDVAAILSTESDLAAGEEFAFKKLNLSSQIAGSGAEGYIIRITTGANASVETMNLTVTARLN